MSIKEESLDHITIIDLELTNLLQEKEEDLQDHQEEELEDLERIDQWIGRILELVQGLKEVILMNLRGIEVEEAKEYLVLQIQG